MTSRQTVLPDKDAHEKAKKIKKRAKGLMDLAEKLFNVDEHEVKEDGVENIPVIRRQLETNPSTDETFYIRVKNAGAGDYAPFANNYSRDVSRERTASQTIISKEISNVGGESDSGESNATREQSVEESTVGDENVSAEQESETDIQPVRSITDWVSSSPRRNILQGEVNDKSKVDATLRYKTTTSTVETTEETDEGKIKKESQPKFERGGEPFGKDEDYVYIKKIVQKPIVYDKTQSETDSKKSGETVIKQFEWEEKCPPALPMSIVNPVCTQPITSASSSSRAHTITTTVDQVSTETNQASSRSSKKPSKITQMLVPKMDITPVVSEEEVFTTAKKSTIIVPKAPTCNVLQAKLSPSYLTTLDTKEAGMMKASELKESTIGLMELAEQLLTVDEPVADDDMENIPVIRRYLETNPSQDEIFYTHVKNRRVEHNVQDNPIGLSLSEEAISSKSSNRETNLEDAMEWEENLSVEPESDADIQSARSIGDWSRTKIHQNNADISSKVYGVTSYRVTNETSTETNKSEREQSEPETAEEGTKLSDRCRDKPTVKPPIIYDKTQSESSSKPQSRPKNKRPKKKKWRRTRNRQKTKSQEQMKPTLASTPVPSEQVLKNTLPYKIDLPEKTEPKSSKDISTGRRTVTKTVSIESTQSISSKNNRQDKPSVFLTPEMDTTPIVSKREESVPLKFCPSLEKTQSYRIPKSVLEWSWEKQSTPQVPSKIITPDSSDRKSSSKGRKSKMVKITKEVSTDSERSLSSRKRSKKTSQNQKLPEVFLTPEMDTTPIVSKREESVPLKFKPSLEKTQSYSIPKPVLEWSWEKPSTPQVPSKIITPDSSDRKSSSKGQKSKTVKISKEVSTDSERSLSSRKRSKKTSQKLPEVFLTPEMDTTPIVSKREESVPLKFKPSLEKTQSYSIPKPVLEWSWEKPSTPQVPSKIITPGSSDRKSSSKGRKSKTVKITKVSTDSERSLSSWKGSKKTSQKLPENITLRKSLSGIERNSRKVGETPIVEAKKVPEVQESLDETQSPPSSKIESLGRSSKTFTTTIKEDDVSNSTNSSARVAKLESVIELPRMDPTPISSQREWPTVRRSSSSRKTVSITQRTLPPIGTVLTQMIKREFNEIRQVNKRTTEKREPVVGSITIEEIVNPELQDQENTTDQEFEKVYWKVIDGQKFGSSNYHGANVVMNFTGNTTVTMHGIGPSASGKEQNKRRETGSFEFQNTPHMQSSHKTFETTAYNIHNGDLNGNGLANRSVMDQSQEDNSDSMDITQNTSKIEETKLSQDMDSGRDKCKILATIAPKLDSTPSSSVKKNIQEPSPNELSPPAMDSTPISSLIESPYKIRHTAYTESSPSTPKVVKPIPFVSSISPVKRVQEVTTVTTTNSFQAHEEKTESNKTPYASYRPIQHLNMPYSSYRPKQDLKVSNTSAPLFPLTTSTRFTGPFPSETIPSNKKGSIRTEPLSIKDSELSNDLVNMHGIGPSISGKEQNEGRETRPFEFQNTPYMQSSHKTSKKNAYNIHSADLNGTGLANRSVIEEGQEDNSDSMDGTQNPSKIEETRQSQDMDSGREKCKILATIAPKLDSTPSSFVKKNIQEPSPKELSPPAMDSTPISSLIESPYKIRDTAYTESSPSTPKVVKPIPFVSSISPVKRVQEVTTVTTTNSFQAQEEKTESNKTPYASYRPIQHLNMPYSSYRPKQDLKVSNTSAPLSPLTTSTRFTGPFPSETIPSNKKGSIRTETLSIKDIELSNDLVNMHGIGPSISGKEQNKGRETRPFEFQNTPYMQSSHKTSKKTAYNIHSADLNGTGLANRSVIEEGQEDNSDNMDGTQNPSKIEKTRQSQDMDSGREKCKILATIAPKLDSTPSSSVKKNIQEPSPNELSPPAMDSTPISSLIESPYKIRHTAYTESSPSSPKVAKPIPSVSIEKTPKHNMFQKLPKLDYSPRRKQTNSKTGSGKLNMFRKAPQLDGTPLSSPILVDDRLVTSFSNTLKEEITTNVSPANKTSQSATLIFGIPCGKVVEIQDEELEQEHNAPTVYEPEETEGIEEHNAPSKSSTNDSQAHKSSVTIEEIKEDGSPKSVSLINYVRKHASVSNQPACKTVIEEGDDHEDSQSNQLKPTQGKLEEPHCVPSTGHRSPIKPVSITKASRKFESVKAGPELVEQRPVLRSLSMGKFDKPKTEDVVLNVVQTIESCSKRDFAEKKQSIEKNFSPPNEPILKSPITNNPLCTTEQAHWSKSPSPKKIKPKLTRSMPTACKKTSVPEENGIKAVEFIKTVELEKPGFIVNMPTKKVNVTEEGQQEMALSVTKEVQTIVVEEKTIESSAHQREEEDPSLIVGSLKVSSNKLLAMPITKVTDVSPHQLIVDAEDEEGGEDGSELIKLDQKAFFKTQDESNVKAGGTTERDIEKKKANTNDEPSNTSKAERESVAEVLKQDQPKLIELHVAKRGNIDCDLKVAKPVLISMSKGKSSESTDADSKSGEKFRTIDVVKEKKTYERKQESDAKAKIDRSKPTKLISSFRRDLQVAKPVPDFKSKSNLKEKEESKNCSSKKTATELKKSEIKVTAKVLEQKLHENYFDRPEPSSEVGQNLSKKMSKIPVATNDKPMPKTVAPKRSSESDTDEYWCKTISKQCTVRSMEIAEEEYRLMVSRRIRREKQEAETIFNEDYELIKFEVDLQMKPGAEEIADVSSHSNMKPETVYVNQRQILLQSQCQ